jgi:hypothetical protein
MGVFERGRGTACIAGNNPTARHGQPSRIFDLAIVIKAGQPSCMGAASSIFREYPDHHLFISS